MSGASEKLRFAVWVSPTWQVSADASGTCRPAIASDDERHAPLGMGSSRHLNLSYFSRKAALVQLFRARVQLEARCILGAPV
ncbi:MAG TPA: hypothetical protein VMU47_13940, partial [Caldimonas sp.]|nr:hypothetical protein [Caldimonas sp.]